MASDRWPVKRVVPSRLGSVLSTERMFCRASGTLVGWGWGWVGLGSSTWLDLLLGFSCKSGSSAPALHKEAARGLAAGTIYRAPTRGIWIGLMF